MLGYPIPDPDPPIPPFESGMAAICIAVAMGFIFWWFLTMSREPIIEFKKWKKLRKEKRT